MQLRYTTVIFPKVISANVCYSCSTTIIPNSLFRSSDKIIRTVLDYFELERKKVFSKSRKKELVNARFFIMFFLKKYTTLSLKSIGAEINGEDHTSVIHGIQTIKDRMDTEDITMFHYECLDKEIYQL